MSRKGKPIETEERLIILGDKVREEFGVFFWGDEKVLKLRSGGCTTW